MAGPVRLMFPRMVKRRLEQICKQRSICSKHVVVIAPPKWTYYIESDIFWNMVKNS